MIYYIKIIILILRLILLLFFLLNIGLKLWLYDNFLLNFAQNVLFKINKLRMRKFI